MGLLLNEVKMFWIMQALGACKKHYKRKPYRNYWIACWYAFNQKEPFLYVKNNVLYVRYL